MSHTLANTTTNTPVDVLCNEGLKCHIAPGKEKTIRITPGSELSFRKSSDNAVIGRLPTDRNDTPIQIKFKYDVEICDSDDGIIARVNSTFTVRNAPK